MEIDIAKNCYLEGDHNAHYDFEKVVSYCEKLVKHFSENGIMVEWSGVYDLA